MLAGAPGASEFPVPADLAGFWMFDQIHAPRPLTPLSQEIMCSAMTEGFCAALRDVGYPLGLFYRTVNHYAYIAFLPLNSAAGTDAQKSTPHHEAVAALMRSLEAKWKQEWLPSILPGLERLRTLDYGALSDDDLIGTFDDLRRDLIARWRIHGFLLFSYQAASMFDDFYRAEFHPTDPMEPYLLLSGVETRSLDSSRGLWRLSRSIRANPALRRLFEQTEASGLAAALEGLAEGRRWLDELRTYADEYGWRSDAITELAEPAWRENVTIPLNAVRGLIALDDAESPDERLRRVAVRREQLLAQARVRLSGDARTRARFDALYEQARCHVALDEDHNFYIDQMGSVALRLPILELGRRLTRREALTRADDVFFLTTTEIRSGLAGADHRSVVAARRAQMAYWAGITPPATLGEPPSEEEVDPFIAALIKVDTPPLAREQAATLIRGTPASPGTARGRAKVARSLEEASAVEPGQILVCEMTLPPWSVVFPTIGAVVADTGGMLSHCATVARECGIPCVVGTIVGTTVIRDGMILAVDGTRGEVRILEAPEPLDASTEGGVLR